MEQYNLQLLTKKLKTAPLNIARENIEMEFRKESKGFPLR